MIRAEPPAAVTTGEALLFTWPSCRTEQHEEGVSLAHVHAVLMLPCQYDLLVTVRLFRLRLHDSWDTRRTGTRVHTSSAAPYQGAEAGEAGQRQHPQPDAQPHTI